MDCSSASAYTRLTLNWSGAPSAPATATSFSVSSSVQGLKSTLPMRTGRPSCSLAIFSPWVRSSQGRASHASAAASVAPAPLGCWIEGTAELLRATRTLVFAQGLVTADGVPCARASGVFKIGPEFPA